MVCDPDTLLCTGCDYDSDVIKGCPEADADTNSYYVCESTGMCTLTVCDAATTCTPGQICSNGTTVCSDVACTEDDALKTCSTYSCINNVCADCNEESSDDGCPSSDSENDTYYVCKSSGSCKKMTDEGITGGWIAFIIIISVLFVAGIVGLIWFMTKKDASGEAAKLEALTSTSD